MPIGIGFIDKLFTSKDGKGIFAQVLEGASNIIDKYHISPEDKMAIQVEFDKVMDEKRQAAIAIYQQDAADTDSARKMNIAIQGDKPSWLAKNISYVLAILITCAWIVLSTVLFKAIVSKDLEHYEAILALYSTVTGMTTIVIGFYFGSSHGSAEKQKTIDRLTA